MPNNVKIIPTKPSFPACQEFHHLFGHNPLFSKHLKKQIPQLSHNITIKNEMIKCFPTLFTHTTWIAYYDVTLAEIIHSELPKDAVQVKKPPIKKH
jgi:hypothetical protein